MVKRGGLEEMCSLLMLVAQEEEQRLALEPGYQGITADGEEPAELDDAERSGLFPLVAGQASGFEMPGGEATQPGSAQCSSLRCSFVCFLGHRLFRHVHYVDTGPVKAVRRMRGRCISWRGPQ